MTKNGNPRFFYGYVIVMACFLIMVVVYGMHSTFGVFFNRFQAEFGWNRATISGGSSVVVLVMGLFAIMAGRLTDVFGPRIVMTVSGCILGLGYFLMSQINSVWQLYLFYGLVVGIGLSSGDVSLLSTTARWFARRRGMMSGIVKVGTGVGIMIMPLVAGWLISSYDWRNAYIILGIVSAVVIVAVAQFLKHNPSQKGLKPYGEHEGDASSSYLVGEGLSLWEAIHTMQLWAFCAASFMMIFCVNTMMVHTAPYAVDLGVSSVRAAGILSTIGGASIAGRFVMGTISDRISCRRALLICFLVLITALSWLQFAKGLWELSLFAMIYGFAHGGYFALISPLVAELFGTRSQGVILGIAIFTGTIGGAVGPVLTGYIFDVTHSYQLAFLISLAVSVMGFILSALIRPIKIKGQE